MDELYRLELAPLISTWNLSSLRAILKSLSQFEPYGAGGCSFRSNKPQEGVSLILDYTLEDLGGLCLWCAKSGQKALEDRNCRARKGVDVGKVQRSMDLPTVLVQTQDQPLQYPSSRNARWRVCYLGDHIPIPEVHNVRGYAGGRMSEI